MDADIEPAADVLGALRTATASRHEKLDAGLPIGRPGATLEDYRAHLAMLRAWLAPIEAWLAGFDDGPAMLAPSARLALIDADLGGAAPAAAHAEWPADASAAYRWGVCYVVEGSQLGGSVLYQRLKQSLAPHPLSYLRGGAEGPGPRWRLFMQALKEAVRTQGEIDNACRGACDAFDRILAIRTEISLQA